jgi:hypothetical protein
MKRTRLKSFIFIVALIAATGAAMAYTAGGGKTWFAGWTTPATHNPPTGSGPLTLSGRLVQNKILQGSDGRVNLALELRASDDFGSTATQSHNVPQRIALP